MMYKSIHKTSDVMAYNHIDHKKSIFARILYFFYYISNLNLGCKQSFTEFSEKAVETCTHTLRKGHRLKV